MTNDLTISLVQDFGEVSSKRVRRQRQRYSPPPIKPKPKVTTKKAPKKRIVKPPKPPKQAATPKPPKPSNPPKESTSCHFLSTPPTDLILNRNHFLQETSEHVGLQQDYAALEHAQTHPSFRPARYLQNVYDRNRIKPVDLHFQTWLRDGFFKASRIWTCYQRNFFRVTGSISSNSSDVYMVNGKKIKEFRLGAIAKLFHCDKEVPLLQYTAKRDVAKVVEPIPMDKNNASLERLQFNTSTENNWRRKLEQHYFVIVSHLFADLHNGERTIVATCDSDPIIVRGRSPGYYFDLDSDAKKNERPVLPPLARVLATPMGPTQHGSTVSHMIQPYMGSSGELQSSGYGPFHQQVHQSGLPVSYYASQNYPSTSYHQNQGYVTNIYPLSQNLQVPSTYKSSQSLPIPNTYHSSQRFPISSTYQPRQNYPPLPSKTHQSNQNYQPSQHVEQKGSRSSQNGSSKGNTTILFYNPHSKKEKSEHSDNQHDRGDKNTRPKGPKQFNPYIQHCKHIPSLPQQQQQKAQSLSSLLLPSLPSTPSQIQKRPSPTSLLLSPQQQQQKVLLPSLLPLLLPSPPHQQQQKQRKRPCPFSNIAAAVALVSRRSQQPRTLQPLKRSKQPEKVQEAVYSESLNPSHKPQRSDKSEVRDTSRRQEISESSQPPEQDLSDISDQSEEIILMQPKKEIKNNTANATSLHSCTKRRA